MKIAIIGSNKEDNLEFNLKIGAEVLGYDAEIFDFSKVLHLFKNGKINFVTSRLIKASTKFNDYIFMKLSEKVRAYDPDLVIATWRFINPIFITKLRSEIKNVKIIHLNSDAINSFGRQEIFMSDYDAYFTKCHCIERFMRNKLNLNVYYLPESFNPNYHKKPDMSKEEAEKRMNIDVMMIGNLYRYRYKFIKNLVEKGVKVKIFGAKPHYIKDRSLDRYFANEYVKGARKAELFYGSKIVLNNFHYAEIESVNCKFFEIAGSGGVQLCDYTIAVEDLLDIGKEVFTFRTLDDAVKKINYLLDHPEIRYAVSKNAYKRSLNEHTYKQRIEEIIKKVF